MALSNDLLTHRVTQIYHTQIGLSEDWAARENWNKAAVRNVSLAEYVFAKMLLLHRVVAKLFRGGF